MTTIVWTVAALVAVALHVTLDANATDTPASDARSDTCVSARASVAAAAPGDATRSETTQYARVIAYLGKAGLLRFVDGPIMSHGSGSSFGVTFRFVTDEASKTKTLAILRNTKIFNSGPLGPGHVRDVGATDRAHAYDFRSVNGALGPRSLEVMINSGTFWGYADIDRFDLYGGLAPASAHILVEFLPHIVWKFFTNHSQQEGEFGSRHCGHPTNVD